MGTLSQSPSLKMFRIDQSYQEYCTSADLLANIVEFQFQQEYAVFYVTVDIQKQ